MNREFFILSWVFWLLMAAAIVVSYGEAPIWVNFIGAALAGSRMILYQNVKHDNPFSIPTIQMPLVFQFRGMYAYVRHPLYVSSVMWFIAIPLVFMSYLGLLASCGLIMITIWRIDMEETFLSRSPDYRDYCGRVRWRLIPGIY